MSTCGTTERRQGVAAALGRAEGATSPPPVTRGESSSPTKQAQTKRAKVDWLNCTFDGSDETVVSILEALSLVMRRPVSGTDGRGMLGFSHSVGIRASVGSGSEPVGCLAFGGESQKGRWLLQLTGHGCGLVADWAGLASMLRALNAKLTRVDLAVDFLEGEHGVVEALDLHACDGFNGGGRRPSSSIAGDWVDEVSGRTVYIGKSANGKMLRVYEKGRQLGHADSEWVRWEVQFGNRDRVLPLEMLTECDKYFAGAYPVLGDLVFDAAECIPATRTEGECTLSHLLRHMVRSYGRLVDALEGVDGFDSSEFVEQVRVFGLPRRVNPSSVGAGVEWADVLAQAKRETA